MTTTIINIEITYSAVLILLTKLFYAMPTSPVYAIRRRAVREIVHTCSKTNNDLMEDHFQTPVEEACIHKRLEFSYVCLDDISIASINLEDHM